MIRKFEPKPTQADTAAPLKEFTLEPGAMSDKPTYDELEYRVRLLEREARWRDEAQRTLKEREAYLQLLFEYAPDMYILCDAKGRLTDANRAAERMTGYRRTDVIGKDLLEAGIIDEDQFEKALNVLARVANKMPTDPEEFTIHKRGGKTLILELRAYPVQMQQEPVVLIIARDITRYRDHIERLEARGRDFRTYFESDPDAALLFEDDTGRIQHANHAARCLFGYDRKEIEGMTIEDFCEPATETHDYGGELRTVKSGANPIGFRGFRTKSGDQVPARILVNKFVSGEKTLSAVRIYQ